jgi:hypothetical protein
VFKRFVTNSSLRHLFSFSLKILREEKPKNHGILEQKKTARDRVSPAVEARLK